MSNPPLYIDIHALQTVPPSNINRDDTGSPKTARFGGVTRARVSSQAWKKAIRDQFATTLDVSEVGQRTKYVVEMIADHISLLDSQIEEEEALSLASEVLAATGIKVGKDGSTGYLLFVSPMQAEGLGRLALEAKQNDEKPSTKAAKSILNIKESPALNAIDIALFGRMVADDPSLNVDAAVQVAHALGVGRSETEYDYFTAMDDRSPEDNAGAAMIETTEFLSAMFYRYATVDVYHLCENLGSHAAACKAIKAFIKAYLTSMPTGKQNSFANRTMPSAVMVTLRNSQSVSLANAFERPVASLGEKSILEVACERLIDQEKYIESAFGLMPVKTYVICAGDGAARLGDLTDAVSCNLNTLIENVGQQVEAYLDSTDLPSGIEEQ